MSSLRLLFIVDLADTPRRQSIVIPLARLLRGIADALARTSAVYRLHPESALDPTDSPVLSTWSLLSEDTLLSVRERANELADDFLATGIMPIVGGSDLGPMNRSIVLTALSESLELGELALEAAALERPTLTIVMSTSSVRARATAEALRAQGWGATGIGLPRLSGRHSGATAFRPLRYEYDDGLCDVLLVTESRPMEGTLAPVADALGRQSELRVGRARGSLLPVSAPAVEEATRRLLDWPATRQLRGGRMEGLILSSVVRDVRRRGAIEQLISADHTGALLDRARPRLLVIGNDRLWSGQLLVREARARGIPVLCVQDGIAADVPGWWFRTADHTAANGSHLRDLLVGHGWPAETIHVVGQPRYDELHARALTLYRTRARAQLELPPLSPTVLVGFQGNHDRRYVDTVLQAIMAIPDVITLVRPHPAQGASSLAGIARLPAERVRLLPKADLVATLVAADLLVSQYSTLMVEGALLGVPTIAASLSGTPEPIDLTTLGIAVPARSAAALTARAAELLAGSTAELANREVAGRRRQAAERLVGPFDGRSADRVATLIRELAAGAAPVHATRSARV